MPVTDGEPGDSAEDATIDGEAATETEVATDDGADEEDDS